MKRIDFGLIVFFWTIVASGVFLFPFVYFTAKVGFWNTHTDKDLVVVPAKIEQLDTVWRSLKCGTRINPTQYCFLAKYSYEYQGKTYTSTKVSSGYFVTTEDNLKALQSLLLKRSSVYVSKTHPDYAVLLNHKDFISNQPYDFKYYFWFSPFFQIPFIVLMLSYLRVKEKTVGKINIRYKYAAVFFRLTSFWCDISLFVAIVGIYSGLAGIFTLSAYHENNLVPFAYLPFVFFVLSFLYRLVFRRSFGMQCANLSFIKVATHEKVSRKMVAIHFWLSLVTIILSAGLVLVLAAFDKKKQTLADKLCGVVIIQPFINEKYSDRSRMLVDYG